MSRGDHYKVDIGCDNCGFEGEIRILKGYPVDEEECPKCECRNLERRIKKEESLMPDPSNAGQKPTVDLEKYCS